MRRLKRRGMLGRVILVAPLRVCYNVWPDEIAKWSDFNGLTYAIVHGNTPAQKEKKLLQALNRDVDIIITNFESLPWLLGLQSKQRSEFNTKRKKVTVDKRRWNSFGFNGLVVDELSKFKRYDTQRFKGMKQVLDTFSFRWGLTGSPAANSLLDLFGQCYILDEGNALGR